MSRDPQFVPQGVIPAVLLPFHEDLLIDEPSFRAHLRDVVAVQGLFIDMHNRMKEALALLGKLPRAVMRPPLVKIKNAEIALIKDALIEAELLGARTAKVHHAA